MADIEITEAPTLLSTGGIIFESSGTRVVFLTYATAAPTTLLGQHKITDTSIRQFPAHATKSIYATCRPGETVRAIVSELQ